jgi:TonB family protein
VTFRSYSYPLGFLQVAACAPGKHGTLRHRQTEEKTVNFTPFRRHARPRRISILFVGLLALFSLFPNYSSYSQAIARKVKNRVEPVYPDLAKRNNISGSARVELLVTPDGRVKDVKVLGGNPVLVQAVMAAVVKWKYEPAAEESSVIIKFDFNP